MAKILTTTDNLSYEEWLDKTNQIPFCRAMQMRQKAQGYSGRSLR